MYVCRGGRDLNKDLFCKKKKKERITLNKRWIINKWFGRLNNNKETVQTSRMFSESTVVPHKGDHEKNNPQILSFPIPFPMATEAACPGGQTVSRATHGHEHKSF